MVRGGREGNGQNAYASRAFYVKEQTSAGCQRRPQATALEFVDMGHDLKLLFSIIDHIPT